ncbi:MAG: hypothetical protein KC777_29995 [Cyanobacteria bacterium HKST-UBA02]|nr:hypothetical protein [Cyanobacteria bacterium HKST-UBA02]
MQLKKAFSSNLLCILLLLTFSFQIVVAPSVVAQPAEVQKLFDENARLIDDLKHKDNDSLFEKTKNAQHLDDRLKDLNKKTEFMDEELASNLYAGLLLDALKAGIIADEGFCRLYRKVRGPGGRFDKAKNSLSNTALTLLDEAARTHCDKKKPTCPKGSRTISDCVSEGAILDLVGDGETTSHCTVSLTNPETGKTTSAQVQTVCISKRSLKPPLPADPNGQGDRYVIGGPAPSGVVNIVKSARKLADAGNYDGISLPPERKVGTITQLSIWQSLAGPNPSPKDAVNEESVTKQVLKRAKLDPKALSPEEKQLLTKKVDDILLAVDLTEKEASTIDDHEPEHPKKPEDSPDTSNPDKGVSPSTARSIPADGATSSGSPDGEQSPETSTAPKAPEGSPVEPRPSPGTPVPAPPLAPGLVCIPEFTVFESKSEECQDMMTIAEAYIDCPESAGGTTGGGGKTTGKGPGAGPDGGPKVPGQGDGLVSDEHKCHFVKVLFVKKIVDSPTDDPEPEDVKEVHDAVYRQIREILDEIGEMIDDDGPDHVENDISRVDGIIFFLCKDKVGMIIRKLKLTDEELKNWEFSDDKKVYEQRKEARKKIIDKYRKMPDQVF